MKRILTIVFLLLLAGCNRGTTEQPIESIVEEEEETTSTWPFIVEVYDEEKAYNGTTLLYDGHDHDAPRVVEVNMEGEVIWEYEIDPNLSENRVGVDTELTKDDTVLITLSGYGVFEVNRDGETVWSYFDPDVSHDADRLENGNTLVVFGNRDGAEDAQVKEVNPDGEIVWQWYAQDVYGESEYVGILNGGWTHTNGAERLENGNTLVNIRNFNLTVIVDPEGNIVKEYDWTQYGEDVDPHEAEANEDAILVCLQRDADYAAVEIDMQTNEIIWEYSTDGIRTSRDCDRLPNGNTLIVTVMTGKDNNSAIIEVTPDGEIVWQMTLDVPLTEEDIPGGGPGYFYKAERIGY